MSPNIPPPDLTDFDPRPSAPRLVAPTIVGTRVNAPELAGIAELLGAPGVPVAVEEPELPAHTPRMPTPVLAPPGAKPRPQHRVIATMAIVRGEATVADVAKFFALQPAQVHPWIEHVRTANLLQPAAARTVGASHRKS